MKSTVRTVAAVAAVAALSLAACSKPSSKTDTQKSVSADKKISIGYFGFAKANSFAQAGWAGVQEYASSHNATATFIDSNFDGPTQVNQLQDAVTSKRFQVVIIQANDGTAMVNPVKQAIAAGIVVVVQFTPIGGEYDTTAAQVPGTINLIDPPTVNGVGLAKLGLEACKKVASGTCKAAYLQGFANYPLDAARTKAAVDTLKAGGADVISNFVGGYTADSGRTAVQNLLQAHPDVNVIIGSSQAIEGAESLVAGKNIALIANGGSTQAVSGIKSGVIYGGYILPEKSEGAMAAELGINKARGQSVPVSSSTCATLTKNNCLVTASNVAGVKADYSD